MAKTLNGFQGHTCRNLGSLTSSGSPRQRLIEPIAKFEIVSRVDEPATVEIEVGQVAAADGLVKAVRNKRVRSRFLTPHVFANPSEIIGESGAVARIPLSPKLLFRLTRKRDVSFVCWHLLNE